MKLLNREYLGNIGVLLSSAVVAQILALLLTPVLTRMYSPEAFGFFNAFVSYSGTMALFLFFSIEFAIVKSRSVGNVNRVLGLLLTVGGISAFVIFSSVTLELSFYKSLGFEKLFDIKFYVFVGALFAAINMVLNSLVTRLRIFKLYAATQIAFVVMRFVITFTLFYMGVEALGLILGFLLPTLLNLLYVGSKTNVMSCKPDFHFLSLMATAKKYRDLIFYNAPGNLINTLIVNFPIFYILKSYSIEEAGFFGLAYRMILMPVSLMNKAVGQVLYREFVDNKNEPSRVFMLVVKNATLLSLFFPVFLILYLYGDVIFTTVFGELWGKAGAMAALMSPFVFCSFVVSPLSLFFPAFDKNKHFSIVNAIFLAILFLGANFEGWDDINGFIEYYTWINLFYYLSIFLMMIFLATSMNRRAICSSKSKQK